MENDIDDLSAEEIVELCQRGGGGLVQKAMGQYPQIELESVGNSVRCTMETPYFYSMKPYSGWRTFEDVEAQP